MKEESIEEGVIERLKSGDRQTLEDVYRLFYDPVFQAAFFVIKDFGLAEDVVHEVFLKVYNKIEQVKEPAKLGNWLCQIAVNEARSMLRQRSKWVPLSGYDRHGDDQSLSPERSLLTQEDRDIMKGIMAQLKPGHRQAVYLKYFEDMSLAEIGTALEIPISTVKTRLFHARQKIRKLLKPERHPERHIINNDKIRG